LFEGDFAAMRLVAEPPLHPRVVQMLDAFRRAGDALVAAGGVAEGTLMMQLFQEPDGQWTWTSGYAQLLPHLKHFYQRNPGADILPIRVYGLSMATFQEMEDLPGGVFLGRFPYSTVEC